MGYFGLVYNTPAFDWNIYLVFIFPPLITIPCQLLQPLFINKVGRKTILTFLLFTIGALLLSTLLVPKGLSVIILASIGASLCSVAFGVGYIYTNELFPTNLRATALGTASAGARVGSLSSPFIAMLDFVDPVMPFAIYGTVVMFAVIVSLWLWPETSQKKLPETQEEAEAAASTVNPWVSCCSRQ